MRGLDDNFRIHRGTLYKRLGFKSDTIPKTAAFERVMMLPRHRYPLGTHDVPGGPYLVTVKAATGAYAAHRIFVTCGCGKMVPSGRLQQHIVACPSEQMQQIRQRAKREGV